jgi:hypothetical protein
MMKHVMIDLETLAVVPGAKMIEIGAAVFDPWESGGKAVFSAEVLPGYAPNDQRVEDAETVAWWADRMEEGCACPGDGEFAMPLDEALKKLAQWFEANGLTPEETMVWSWGIDFDPVILRDAISQCGVGPVWKYANQRDARTLCKVADVKKAKPFHCALSDVLDEIVAVQAAVKVLGIPEGRAL